MVKNRAYFVSPIRAEGNWAGPGGPNANPASNDLNFLNVPFIFT